MSKHKAGHQTDDDSCNGRASTHDSGREDQVRFVDSVDFHVGNLIQAGDVNVHE